MLEFVEEIGGSLTNLAQAPLEAVMNEKNAAHADVARPANGAARSRLRESRLEARDGTSDGREHAQQREKRGAWHPSR